VRNSHQVIDGKRKSYESLEADSHRCSKICVRVKIGTRWCKISCRYCWKNCTV